MEIIIKPAFIRTEDEIYWDNLVEQIWEGNVIPVIGENLVVDNTTISEELVKYLAQDKGLTYTPRNFSELYFDKDFKPHQSSLYEEISSLIKANQDGFKPTQVLEDFLSIEQFPFVITTSVDYTVEETMRKIWAKRERDVRCLIFSNDASHNDDIKSDADIKKPTVYYMFGKANNYREHSFVLTEEDMLAFCQSWLSDRHPTLLSKVIGSKYLLFLGVNYPDWLIRFMWYSMRSNLRESGLLVDQREFESSLIAFFQRVSIKAKKEPANVIKEIKTRLEKKKAEYEEKKFDHVQENCDFFISYSRRDEKAAELLYNALTNQGYKVWYDRKNITIGSEWEVEIRRGIRTAKNFIALLSDNIANEVNEHHPYRTEWDIALGQRMHDMSFVKPIYIGNIEILKNKNLGLPEDLAHIHSEVLPSVNEQEVEKLTQKIISSLS